MTNQDKVNALRAALKAVRYEIQLVLSTDKNPSRGDLHRVDRIASQSLEESK